MVGYPEAGRGRIVAGAASNAAPFSTLLTTVPAGHNGTLFLLLGDCFGWGAIALLLFVVVGSARLKSFGAGKRRKSIAKAGLHDLGVS